jgi:hypothetical protein
MPHPNQHVVERHPDVVGVMVALHPSAEYDADDPIVRAYPQFFADIEDSGRIVESVKIESASAAPGEKRSRSRAK